MIAESLVEMETRNMENRQSSMAVSNPINPALKTVHWPVSATYGCFVAVLALIPTFIDSPYTLHVLILTFIYTIASVSLRTITISGQFPLAHGAFMGVGAYVAGMASRWLGWPVWITIPTGAVAAMMLGVLSGYPFSRLRALYYAMGSMFFGIAIINVICAFGDYTGSYGGMIGIKPLFATSKVPSYYFFLGMVTLSTAALYRFEFSRIGLNLKAITQSHEAASAVGINESFYRVLAVGVGCFFAGLAGAGYAHYNCVLSPVSFNFLATLWLVMNVLIGGIDSFSGPIVGTFILFLLPEAFRDFKLYSPFVSAALLIVVTYFMPKGLASMPKMLIDSIIQNGLRNKDANDA